MGAHIVSGRFQSDKYPTCPPGKVPLSVEDSSAQDLLWEYAQRRRSVDAEFADDLEAALRAAGYASPVPIPMRITCPVCGELHLDENEFATKAHHTHSCQRCGLTWRPAVVPTVGVRFLPGFRNEAPSEVDDDAGAPAPADPVERAVGRASSATPCSKCKHPRSEHSAGIGVCNVGYPGDGACACGSFAQAPADDPDAAQPPSPPARSARVCARCNGAGVVTLAALGERTITCPACKGVPR